MEKTINKVESLRPASPINLGKKIRPGETLIQSILFFCGAVSILTTIGIVYELGKEAWLFFGDPEISLVEFSPQPTGARRLANTAYYHWSPPH